MTIKLIALELDYTLWSGHLDEKLFGKGRNASSLIEDNLELVNERVIRDRSNERNYITLFPDVSGIIHDILKNGIIIAVVSRNSSKALCDRALWHYKANDANNGSRSIISLVTYDEVSIESKVEPFERIRGWSGLDYEDMILFDSDPSSNEVHQRLGVGFKLLDRSTGLGWREYKEALLDPSDPHCKKDPYDTPYYGQPPLGELRGSGKFGSVYESHDDPKAVIKVMKHWVTGLRPRFLEIYNIINTGKLFKPNNTDDDQYLTMIAFELRNLRDIKQLVAPRPEQFTGWFSMTRTQGTPLWETPLYKSSHSFHAPFRNLIKTAFHLTVDEIEDIVRKYGIEHRDAHLGNVVFTLEGDRPLKAHLFDWGIAVRMNWDGQCYIRGDEIIVWGESDQGRSYTPEEFRQYWITWMVKTEYEANMNQYSIIQGEGKSFLEDLKWWFEP